VGAAAAGALIRRWLGKDRNPLLTPTESRWLGKAGFSQAPGALFAVIATGDLKGLRNSVGTLCLAGGAAAPASPA
jgi:hypothetical protein